MPIGLLILIVERDPVSKVLSGTKSWSCWPGKGSSAQPGAVSGGLDGSTSPTVHPARPVLTLGASSRSSGGSRGLVNPVTRVSAALSQRLVSQRLCAGGTGRLEGRGNMPLTGQNRVNGNEITL